MCALAMTVGISVRTPHLPMFASHEDEKGWDEMSRRVAKVPYGVRHSTSRTRLWPKVDASPPNLRIMND